VQARKGCVTERAELEPSFRDGNLKTLPEHVKQTFTTAAANAQTIETISESEPLPGGLCPMEN
jgi:hypothetical protein